MYRNTFGIGHSLKEITEAHNTRHPLDPHKGSFGINHDGICLLYTSPSPRDRG